MGMGIEPQASSSAVSVRENGAHTRVLFVTTDTTVFETNSVTQQYYRALTKQFAEVHVLLLVGRGGNTATVRLAPNLWLYRGHAHYRWQLPRVAHQFAHTYLSFNGSFQPDVIVGCDPLYAGLSAMRIADAFSCPLQIEVTKNYVSPEAANELSLIERRIVSQVLRGADSVRTRTSGQKRSIMSRYKHINDVAVMPMPNYGDKLPVAVPTGLPALEKYSNVILLYSDSSTAHDLPAVLQALQVLLQDSSIGVVVIGDGSTREMHQAYARELGVHQNILWQAKRDEHSDLYKVADVILELETHHEADERILYAAAQGTTVIAAVTELRNDLFRDGESALFFEANDWVMLSRQLTKLLRDRELQQRLVTRGQVIGKMCLPPDSVSYHAACRSSVESMLLADYDTQQK